MQINVTVDDISLESVVGEHHVQISEDDYRTEPQTLADVIVDRIVQGIRNTEEYRDLRRRVNEVRDEEIREAVRPAIAEAVSAPVQPTDYLGNPTGEPKPLSTLIADEARSYLSKKEGYGAEGRTIVQKMIREEVDRSIKTELKSVIDEEKAKVVAAVRAKASELIAEAVKQGVGR